MRSKEPVMPAIFAVAWFMFTLISNRDFFSSGSPTMLFIEASISRTCSTALFILSNMASIVVSSMPMT